MPKIITVVMLVIALSSCAPRTRITPSIQKDRIALLLAKAVSINAIEATGELKIEYGNQTLSLPFKMLLDDGRNLEIEADVQRSSLLPAGWVSVKSSLLSTDVETSLGFVDLSPTGLKPQEIYPCLVAFFAGADLLLPFFEQWGCEVSQRITCRDLNIKLDFDDRLEKVVSWEMGTNGRMNFKARVTSFEDKTNRPISTIAVVYPHQILLRIKYSSIEVRTKP